MRDFPPLLHTATWGPLRKMLSKGHRSSYEYETLT
ncbi:hypothetical protein SPHINGO391_440108 [Sphingomonas aurantiaca]|uniref:Uncharacterized protein n=1 Tax=Sphingomonas aurantiaca TaxID=185949 RepID=A0A5E7Z415_9SPHN|nr:hypothetical protein SPHINGO391_440108 [Sphingomonas aurantiaca]